MAHLHLRIIDGIDRGRIFDRLSTPVTIGREEGNSIQLNDDRVSRFHAKIQEDRDKVVLTDLTSTNGTLVNSEDVQLRILRHGDLITIGRSILLYGSRDEIAARLAGLRGQRVNVAELDDDERQEALRSLVSLDFELGWSHKSDLQSTLHTLEPPESPTRLDAVQSAQLSELLQYFHLRIRRLINAARVDDKSDKVTIDARRWQDLIDLQARLAEYIRAAGEPDVEE